MHTLVTDSVDKAAEILQSGELVAFPTETVFGLGALLDNKQAVEKIFLTKGRAKDNPLIVHISDINMLNILVEEVNENAQKLITNFWPGPLTIIFKKQKTVPDYITAGLSTVAVRMPKHKVAQNLIAKCNSPIVAPSANLSGKPSSTKCQHVLEDFDEKIACVLKGETVYGLESTVIDCTVDNPIILRAGAVSKEQIQKLVLVEENFAFSDKPKSPGMKYRHYSPHAKVVLLNNTNLQNNIHSNTKVAYIGLTNQINYDYHKKLICKSLEEYAENLFAFFRECDAFGVKTIYCEQPENLGLGVAINERLNKAAGE